MATTSPWLIVYEIFTMLICIGFNTIAFFFSMFMGTYLHQYHDGVTAFWIISFPLHMHGFASSWFFLFFIFYDTKHYCYMDAIWWMYIGFYSLIFIAISYTWRSLIPEQKDKLGPRIRLCLLMFLAVCHVLLHIIKNLKSVTMHINIYK